MTQQAKVAHMTATGVHAIPGPAMSPAQHKITDLKLHEIFFCNLIAQFSKMNFTDGNIMLQSQKIGHAYKLCGLWSFSALGN